ncbi:hypothetical protein NLJ89_g9147 [Agrocybe chaxingu]|uniref:F-box domain-containing protein n=1 Tax=Agrocybe chaxingu TaxID=84603 RepID=A0A9W8JU30_9AGAR|nr:hypothetical protein NLJ89_g9147 [Agrocybe chaxingu]
METIDVSGASGCCLGGKACRACKEISDLDRKIEQLLGTLQQLVRERCDLKTKRNYRHDPLVRNLPLELLSRIFVFCQPDPPMEGSSALYFPLLVHSLQSRPNLTPITLGSVCRRWREIVQATPRLWTFISINIGRHDMQTYTPFIDTWLSRSGRLPLTIAIFESKGSEPDEGFLEADEDTDPSGLIKVVNTLSSRWECLDVSISTSVVLKQLQCDLSGAPGLESLRIRTFPNDDSTDYPTFNEGIPFMPSPRNVFLSSMRPDSVFIRWNLVKCVNINHVNPAELLMIFADAANISHVHIRSLTRDRDLPLHPVVHRALRMLKFVTSQNIDDILNNLTVPSLQSLHVRAFSPSLTSMIARSKPPLTDMTIRSNIVWDEALQLFKHTPFLSELHLINIAVVPRKFFRRLADTSTISPSLDGRYLPALSSLRILTIQNSFVWQDIVDAFGPNPLNAAATRRPLTAFLLHMPRTKAINVPDSGPDEVSLLNAVALRQLRILRAGGISVSIVDAGGRDLLAENGNGMDSARDEDEGCEEA